MEFHKSIPELFPHPFLLNQLRLGIEEAIGKSFDRQRVRSLTKAEVQRRFDICSKWAVTLRGELGWGTERIVGALDDILKTELDGRRYEPSERQVWMQNDGA